MLSTAVGVILLVTIGIRASEVPHNCSTEIHETNDATGQHLELTCGKKRDLGLSAQSPLTASIASASTGSKKSEKHPWWKWLLFPFRHSGSKVTMDPCRLGDDSCCSEATPLSLQNGHIDSDEGMTLVHTRADWGGLIGLVSHRWLEMETSNGRRTIGFGPATIPFIDTGQIGIRDECGNVERISGAHPVSVLTLPDRKRNYAEDFGSGKEAGKPFLAPRKRADEIVESESMKKGTFLYIPLFNDCRTYVCKLKAKLQGKSGIWCHLLFKGYW